MIKRTLSLLFLSLCLFHANHASAAASPIALDIVAPIQFPPSDFNVTGLRLSALWGHHREMYGIDIGGLGNVTDQTFAGIGLSGLFNITNGTTTAVFAQMAGLFNYNSNKTSVYGIQLALVNYNTAASGVFGLDVGIANLTKHTVVGGIQVGVYNVAQSVYGLQIGLVNETDSLSGLQIGLVNFHHNGVFAVAPFLNFGF